MSAYTPPHNYQSYWIYNPVKKDFIRFNKLNKLRSDDCYFQEFGTTMPDLWLASTTNPRFVFSEMALLNYCKKMTDLFSQYPNIGMFCPAQFCIDIFGEKYQFPEHIARWIESKAKIRRVTPPPQPPPPPHPRLPAFSPLHARPLPPPTPTTPRIVSSNIKLEPESYYHLPSGLLDDDFEKENKFKQNLSSHTKIYPILRTN